MVRLTIFIFRLWRDPPSRRTALVMLVALVLSVALLLVEHFGFWPKNWQVNPRINQPGISRM